MGKRLRDKMGKISVQLGILILVANLIFLVVCFMLLYKTVGDILQDNYEENCVKRFKQAEYNINNLFEQVSQISSTLTADYGTYLSMKRRGSLKVQIPYLRDVMSDYNNEIERYPFIDSIVFFGAEGTILWCDGEGGETNYFYERESLNNAYYLSDIYRVLSESQKQLRWFGAYTKSDLGYGGKQEENTEYYISAVRNMSNNLGQLVINISMKYVSDLISVEKGGNEGEIYVIDENNRIIVSGDPDIVGCEKVLYNGKNVKTGIVRYEVETEEERMQVMTYSLPTVEWKIVEEVPVSEVVKERIRLRNILISSCMISVIISFTISLRWIMGVVGPVNKLTTAVKEVRDGRFGYTLEKIPKNEVGILVLEFNRMSSELEGMLAEKVQMEREKRDLEMMNLRNQINPHLIYNTLNTIKWMAIIDEEQNIVESITLLSDFLEPVFKNQTLLCTVREELDYIEKYIALMNLRVGGGYTLKVNVPEEYLNYKILRFLLQPIVENSILHGLKGRMSGEITISMCEMNNDILIQIEDDGYGINPSVLQELLDKKWDTAEHNGNIGIGNVERRIKNQYGDSYGITIRNGAEKGAVNILRIRKEK